MSKPPPATEDDPQARVTVEHALQLLAVNPALALDVSTGTQLEVWSAAKEAVEAETRRLRKRAMMESGMAYLESLNERLVAQILCHVVPEQELEVWSYEVRSLRLLVRPVCHLWARVIGRLCRRIEVPWWRVARADFLSVIHTLPFRHGLDLRWCAHLAEDVFASLHPDLRVLWLGHSYQIGDGPLRGIVEKCSNLQSLDLTCCRAISDEGAARLAALSGLTSLSLRQCHGVGDTTLAAIGASLTNLTSLDLADCYNVTDDGLANIAKGCPLTSLDVSVHLFGSVQGARGPRDAGAWSCQHFQCGHRNVPNTLECQGCSLSRGLADLVTDAGLAPIIARGKLKELRARGRSALSLAVLRELATSRCPLQTLDMSWCQGLEGSFNLMRQLPSLQTVDLSYSFNFVWEGMGEDDMCLPDRPISERRLGVGSEVFVLDTVGRWYLTRVVQVQRAGQVIQVHYNGWSRRWWEWLDLERDQRRICQRPRYWMAFQ